MANYIKSGPCPSCGSSDARAEYSDGTFFCFSCSVFTGAGLKDRLKPRESKEKSVKIIDTSQWQYSLPKVATEWLNKYGITQNEITSYGLRWNPALTSKLWDGPTGALAMPLFTNGVVTCVSYRLFDQDKPKSITLGFRPYITIGNIEVTLNHGQEQAPGETVIIVEDYISALKVSRILPCVPLLGSAIPDDAILRLSKTHTRLLIWLDMDKAVPALKITSKARLLGLEAGTICTELDPKDHSDLEIFSIVNRDSKIFLDSIKQ